MMTLHLENLEPRWPEFRRSYADGKPQVLCVRPATTIACLSTIDDMAYVDGSCFLIENSDSRSPNAGFVILGCEPDAAWICRDGTATTALPAGSRTSVIGTDDHNPLASLRRLLQDNAELRVPAGLPPGCMGLFGYVAYDFLRAIGRLPSFEGHPLPYPEAHLVRPSLTAVISTRDGSVALLATVWPCPELSAEDAYARAQERLKHLAERLTRMPAVTGMADAGGSAAPPLDITQDDRAHFRSMVNEAKAALARGEARQIGLSRNISMPGPSTEVVFAALRRHNPSPFMFRFDFCGLAIVGTSPRVLVRVRDRNVSVEPIGGTRPRGTTPEEDEGNATDLLADPKETAEHQMLLDSALEEVASVSDPDGVSVTSKMQIERFSKVMHLGSIVEGTLRADKDCVDALFAAFPASTVVGVPKQAATELVEKIEQRSRGIYGGAVGTFDASGGMDMYMAIRMAVVAGGRLSVQAGASITAQSDPDAEFEETENKARAVLIAAGALAAG